LHRAGGGTSIRRVARPGLNLRSAWLLLPLAVATTAAASLVMGIVGVAVGLAWFLFLAARFDNHTGSCFMVAVLVVLVLATLATLMGFLALFAR
jgi:heme/copper-type cytochrome/quinol oxidase subunit 4